MNDLPTLPPLPAPESTSDYQPSTRSQVRAEGRMPIALVAGTGSQPAGELRALLRKRLQIVALLGGGACILALVLVCGIVAPLNVFVFGQTWRPNWGMLGSCGLLLILASASAALLRFRPSLSLRSLRAIELVLFGTIWAIIVALTVDDLAQGLLRKVARQGSPSVVSQAEVVPWLLGMILYGIFIPNTWRRCALIVLGIALSPMILFGLFGFFDPQVPWTVPVSFLLGMGFWLVFGAAIAIYGSHRIESMRQQAAEARRLGQYQLGRRLGAGGMGEVYLAEHALLRRPCAVKLIRPEQAGDPKHMRRFEREVQATATLTHPNTIQIFDYGHTPDGTFYYVMEYLPGLSLEQLVEQEGPLPPARAIHFLRQVCGALREAHAIGLIHRDLKPSNIMICERGGQRDVAKLLDFGLVQTVASPGDGETRLTQEGTITGTPTFMSPEHAGGKDDVDARSDIYCLGCVAYFLLTGKPPFAGHSTVQILAAHLYEAPAPLTRHRPDVPADLQEVVLRCLAKNPAERYADVDSLDRAFASCHSVGSWTESQGAGSSQRPGNQNQEMPDTGSN